jgi:hypothetical protein
MVTGVLRFNKKSRGKGKKKKGRKGEEGTKKELSQCISKITWKMVLAGDGDGSSLLKVPFLCYSIDKLAWSSS